MKTENPLYILIQSDGYSMEKLGQSSSEDEMKRLMKKEYDELYPYDDSSEDELSEYQDFKDMSEFNDDSAILYDRGENVYIWQIFQIQP